MGELRMRVLIIETGLPIDRGDFDKSSLSRLLDGTSSDPLAVWPIPRKFYSLVSPDLISGVT